MSVSSLLSKQCQAVEK